MVLEESDPTSRKSQSQGVHTDPDRFRRRSHLLIEDIDLSTHILDITQEFEYEDLDNVILVGHSYGGMVISGVAERIPDRIKRLVYLDGYIPEDGKTAFDLIPGLEGEYMKRSLGK